MSRKTRRGGQAKHCLDDFATNHDRLGKDGRHGIDLIELLIAGSKLLSWLLAPHNRVFVTLMSMPRCSSFILTPLQRRQHPAPRSRFDHSACH